MQTWKFIVSLSVTTFFGTLTAQIPIAASATSGLQVSALIADWHANAAGRNLALIRTAIDTALSPEGAVVSSGDERFSYGPGLLAVYRQSLKPEYWAATQKLHDALEARLASPAAITPETRYGITVFAAMYDATSHEGYGDVVRVLRPQPAGDQSAWTLAALVDACEWLPADAPERKVLLDRLHAVTPVVLRRKAETPTEVRLRLYAELKAIRLGLLAQKTEAGEVNAARSLPAAPVGDAASLLLASEVQQADTEGVAQSKVVAVDAWFNSQTRKDPTGKPELFHYKWDDDADSGFGFFGRAFQRFGAKLATVAEEPTVARLNGANVYIIASPDILTKNPNPHYMNAQDADAIAAWVREGGVLAILQNDGPNAEFEHFNMLTERFGIHLNPVSINHVDGTHWEQGQVLIPVGTGIFKAPHVAYMKEICTITTSEPAKPVLRDELHHTGDVYMAVAHYGKGTVLAVVDPWLYNEYIDGRKLPAEYDQWAAAKELAGWLLEQAR